jgi:hypothetical protein
MEATICDPLSAIALAGSAIATGVSYEGQQATNAANQQANDDWLATQRAAAAKATAADEANRQKATASLNTAETTLGPENQTAVQQGAATDLNSQMLAGSPAAGDSNIKLLGGEPADTSVSSDMASRVTDAAREAQGRIKALAGVTSYGGGYQGMGSTATQALADSAEGINLASDFRKGDTSTLAITQAIQPVHYQQGSDIAGTIASQLGNIAGSAFAKSSAGQSLKSAFSG